MNALKKTTDPELAERLHAFEVVCKIAIQLNVLRVGGNIRGGIPKLNFGQIGAEEFGLTTSQTQYCVGRARNWLADIRERDRARNAARMKRNPTQFQIAA